MMNKVLLAIVLLGFLICGWVSGQVATPSNYPHALGYSHGVGGQSMGPGPNHVHISRGPTGYSTLSMNAVFSSAFANILYSPTMQGLLRWSTADSYGSLGYCVVNKDSLIWFCEQTNGPTHVSVFNRQAQVQSQFQFSGMTVRGMVVDTSGHVYISYQTGSGVGVTRFSTGSFVADWHRLLPSSSGSTVTELKWGIDGRLWVYGGGRLTSLDANGNVMRVYQNVFGPWSEYPDHGLALLSQPSGNNLITVTRVDSNVVVRWQRQLTLPNMFGSPVQNFVTKVNVMPASQDLVIDAEVTGPPSTCSSQQNAIDIWEIVVNKNGNFVGTVALNPSTSDRFPLYAGGISAQGDPIFVIGTGGCLSGTYQINSLSLCLRPGFTTRQACGGQGGMTVVPVTQALTVSTLGGSATVGSLNITPLTKTITFSTNMSGWGSNYLYNCKLPCVTVDPVPLGGGLVQFQDSVFGFHTLRYAFGDGTFGNSPDPLHQYPGAGSYPFQLIATNGCGSDTVSLNYNPCPSGQIQGTTALCVGSGAWIRDVSGNPQDSLSWLVNGVPAGGGDSLWFQPGMIGTYLIGLVTRAGACRDTVIHTVTVNNSAPTAGFSYTLGSPNTLVFQNSSTNATSYSWTFGDGGSSTVANPSHNYAVNDTHTICLVANNGCGSNTTCQTWTCLFPTASFTVSMNGDTATVTSTSQMATSLQWDFGDGFVATGNNVTHAYDSTGLFNICLIAQNGCAADTSCTQVMSVAGNSLYDATNGSTAGLDGNIMVALPSGKYLLCGKSVSISYSVASLHSSSGRLIWARGLPIHINDAVLQPNGRFLLAGNMGTTSQSWLGTLDTLGNVMSTWTLPTCDDITDIEPTLDGGYLLMATNFVVKLNSSLQSIWSGYMGTNRTVFAGFQAPDSTYWVVTRTSPGRQMQFLHFGQNLIGMEQDTCSINNVNPNIATNIRSKGMLVDCEGSIYVLVQYIQNNGGTQEVMSLIRYNPTLQSGVGKVLRFTVNGPLGGYTPVRPVGMVFLGTDSIRVMCQANSPPGFPGSYRLFVDLDRQSLSGHTHSFGTNGVFESPRMLKVLPTGAFVERGSRPNGSAYLRKYRDFEDCGQPAAPFQLHPNVQFTTTFGRMPAHSPAVSPYLHSSSALTLSPTVVNQATTYLCAEPCPSTLVAGFTYTLVGQTATLVNTSGPGATVRWTIPGMNCVLGDTVVATFASLPQTVSITAWDGCKVSTFTGLIQACNLSMGADIALCAGDTAILQAPVGWSNPVWSTGATTGTLAVTAAGSYSLQASDVNGCIAQDTLAVTALPAPVVSVGADVSYCPDTTVNINGPSGWVSYLWSNGGMTAATQVGVAGPLWLEVTDTNGCRGADTLLVSVDTTCVWPGDANHDGVADHVDVLSMGLTFGGNGPLRGSASPLWYGQAGPNWGSVVLGAPDTKHADADGNGTVSYLDTTLVHTHYGSTHSRGGGLGGVPLWVLPEQDSFPVGDTAYFQILWGDASMPVSFGHGVAFRMSIDPQYWSPGPLWVEYPNSFLGNGLADLLPFTRLSAGGNWDLALSRRDGVGRNGWGAVMRVGFVPQTSIPLSATLGYVPVVLSGGVEMDENSVLSALATSGDSVFVYDPVNGVGEAAPLMEWRVYPNPVSDRALVDLVLGHASEVGLCLRDLRGREVWVLPSVAVGAGVQRMEVDVRGLAGGMYLLELQVDGRRYGRKLRVDD